MEKSRVKPKPTMKSRRKRFVSTDLDSARLILADVDGHGGDSSLAVIFARSVVAKAEAEQQERCS